MAQYAQIHYCRHKPFHEVDETRSAVDSDSFGAGKTSLMTIRNPRFVGTHNPSSNINAFRAQRSHAAEVDYVAASQKLFAHVPRLHQFPSIHLHAYLSDHRVRGFTRLNGILQTTLPVLTALLVASALALSKSSSRQPSSLLVVATQKALKDCDLFQSLPLGRALCLSYSSTSPMDHPYLWHRGKSKAFEAREVLTS
ncbi:hypothetical protein PAXRUDRAFT_308964 [Paxillus rubicundulus Ve08.2h10]|uniref:Uncharacterized protein n=1 Tax=Paxillus rubicundulus Ve08.2h10 TaxID=930991 RepID=A0A0D0EAB4_9AGAM|nr:hypothetical protein PAXRUDRAFT_308964 [Paxillus rubicundulus Ve08.2h10]